MKNLASTARALMLFLALASPCHAYIHCVSDILTINGSLYPSYHNFNEAGVTGKIVFVNLSAGSCRDMSTNTVIEPTNGSVYVVFGGVENADKSLQQWLAWLVTAQTAKLKMRFQSTSYFKNSGGRIVIQPYLVQMFE